MSRLNDQVDKVLQIARIEKSGFHLRIESLDLNEIIRQITQNYLANNSGKLAITLALSPGAITVKADRMHLSNIFYNLLDNAMKYAGENPEIKLTTTQNDNRVIVVVSDNGPGIDRVHQKRIFQKFYRVPTANIHDVKGFGLGLFYVKSICDAHHWKITLDSAPAAGATFILEIPVK